MASLELEDKVIVVTGGSQGIGAVTVRLLQDLGAKVAFTDIAITDGESKALAIQADVTNLAAMEAAAVQIEEELGSVYGVVANAGITRDKLFTKLTPEDWDAVLNVNLKGVTPHD